MANTNDTIDLYTYHCSDKGLIFPSISEYTWSLGARAALYMLGLLWCFFAVAIVADTFMCGIERITSKTRVIQIADPNTKSTTEVEVKVWNDTVANLSLLAFGTSAPEILLSVIEILGNNFVAGELGPGTIVGSASFNLLVITPICIISIPKGDTRRIFNMRVFILTTFSSMFAYLWLIFVMVGSSPGVVDVWEACVTLSMFPILILSAFLADKKCCFARKNKTSSEVEIGLDLDSVSQIQTGISGSAHIIEIAREVEKDPSLSEDAAAQIVAARLAANQHHNSLWYRVNATRLMTGGHKLVPNVSDTLKEIYEHVNPEDGPGRHDPEEIDQLTDGGRKSVIEFTASSCAVLENEGSVRIGIRRFGNTASSVSVSVETIDGSAEADQDYKPYKDNLTFKPKETLKEIFIEIVDDDVWEPDEFFFVKLFLQDGQNEGVALGKVSINQVTIVNDDEPGKFEFSKPSFIVKESNQKATLAVNRINGADGEVAVCWKTKDLSAKNGVDYLGGEGKVKFKHGETSKVLSLQINQIMASHEPNFQVELYGPTGGSEIGKISKTIVTIINDEEFNHMVSRIANKTKKNLQGLQLDTSSWSQQFHDAFNVNGGDAESTTCLDYLMHFITFFWKVLFAFIPPPSIGGGWLTFIVSLMFIAFFTAIISDLASIFGCLIDLSPTITAMTFVALGTSMPDMFASKLAAVNEKYADSSIGNINGSNSVNVFLGLGLPWLIASVYWHLKGQKFTVPTGSLAFSVVLYTSASIGALVILMLRRYLSVFGRAELGGPTVPKILSGLSIFLLWVIYIVVASLQAQKIINVSF